MNVQVHCQTVYPIPEPVFSRRLQRLRLRLVRELYLFLVSDGVRSLERVLLRRTSRLLAMEGIMCPLMVFFRTASALRKRQHVRYQIAVRVIHVLLNPLEITTMNRPRHELTAFPNHLIPGGEIDRRGLKQLRKKTPPRLRPVEVEVGEGSLK